MAKVLITESYLTDIADAIRERAETNLTYLPSEMPDAIRGLLPFKLRRVYDTFEEHGEYEANAFEVTNKSVFPVTFMENELREAATSVSTS